MSKRAKLMEELASAHKAGRKTELGKNFTENTYLKAVRESEVRRERETADFFPRLSVLLPALCLFLLVFVFTEIYISHAGVPLSEMLSACIEPVNI
jgi:hypothetical protein